VLAGDIRHRDAANPEHGEHIVRLQKNRSKSVPVTRSSWLVGLGGSSATKDNINAREYQLELAFGQLSHTLAEISLIERHDLRDVGDRLFWKTRCPRR